MLQTLQPASRAKHCALLSVVAVALAAGCGDSDASDDPAAGGGGGGSPAAAGTGAAGSGSAGTGGASGAGTGGGSGASAGQSGGTAGSAGAAPEPTGELYGSMNITLVAAVQETMAAPMTSVLGKFNDGPTPTPSAWQVKSEANGCKLYTPRVLFCEPACDRTTQVCVDDDTCAAYPKATSVGTVRLAGVGPAEITMDPVANNYQPKAGTAIPHPPCAEGAAITLSAAGGGHDPFSITGKCITPLAFEAMLTLEKDKPLKLTWTPPGQASLAKIGVKLDISHHGGSKGKIECEVDDTGALEIPAAMATSLLDLGVAGFPTIVVTRKASAAGSGKAQNVVLNIASPVERAVAIPGLNSCTDSAQCPMGQTCQADLTCK